MSRTVLTAWLYALTLLSATAQAATLPAQTPATASASSPTLITEPDQGLTPIYTFMQSATKTLDMTMYELVDTTAEQTLVQLAANGVTVRVILDQNLESSNNQAAYTYLSQNGVNVVWANPTYAATHQKSIVVDGKTAAIMTLNLTSRYYSTSRDFAVIDSDANDVAAIETVFNADFNSSSITPPAGDDLVWSPTQSQTDLVNLINSAQSTLQVENEEMSNSKIVTALVNAAKRGVTVQVAMTYSSDWVSNFDKLSAAGVQISTYASSASLYIHAKAILVDYGTPQANLFIGSENFSVASLTKNRELGLETTNAAILSSIQSTLTADFNGGTPFSSSSNSDERLLRQSPFH
ncbi:MULTISPECIES: phospholipase D-like domain-containing protein [Paraburkholderia]|uniref:phospholipase D-like domain-containing protein n=1 Tax=Paraburkholderia TaxID=1822464 RepID=UPI0022524B51|nr:MULTISPECIES: phospholipase D-like domain-containing protein [Paraburkholderia]MCX4165075.1 phospholipase D-like domain-containing protein [Paraburkholderia megapolitana]MDN7160568.1 phospholipase D-like domain-containing protein [Paraburkholderia sp. CHISQ3]MDQ6497615.1 phospholipase D-like domain-containing protein [Paraburkholderia megapolitana]